jgi:RHS repeat-associated protein
MKSFKLDTDSVIKVKLVCEEQFNSLYFDDVILYESKEVRTDLDNVIKSSPIDYSYLNGAINSETMTWSQNSDVELSMGTSYEYKDGKISEYKDINGISTYYTYNSRTGLLSGVGHNKNENDVLTDVTTLKYDEDSLLEEVNQTIKNIESNQAIVLSTDYIRDAGKIVEVEHNGFSYIFDYNEDGTVKSIYTENYSLANPNYTDNRIDYTYTSEGDISIINYSNNYRVKHISTESESGKTITIDCCFVEPETQTEELIKSYVYNFNEKGEITRVYDSGTDITILYEGCNYTINESDGVLYQKSIDENGNIVESYAQAYFHDLNNTTADTITQTPSVVSYGDNDVTIKSSTVCINKNVDDFVSTFNYTRSSVTDYFNRIVEKETILDYSRPRDLTGKTVVNTEYSYQELGDNKTSGLVSEYTSTISKVTSSNTTALSSYNRKYEYDNKGNIKFVYTETNGTITPKNYYEYDNANQLITEIDFEKRLCAHYTYNAGGNLTAKIYYDYSALVFDITNRKITTLGNETSRITYGYDSVWTDRLTNYNGTQINYDKLGNPLNFVGIDHDNATVTGTLEWTGDLLTAFETTDDRYTYQYDINGYRTSKTVYEKETESNANYYWREIYTMRYIWENGVLTGMTYSSLKNDGTRHPEQNINLIYDEDGSPVGYVTMLGVPYYFSKDINENVLSLIYTDGSKLCSFSYDSWGLPKATYHGENILVQAISKLTAVFCPVTYHGYLYDYETGLYFNKGRCYSPSWGRYLNPEDPISLTENSISPLDANLYLFCNNNTVNYLDKTASWSRNYNGVNWTANGFDVEMSKIFSSRAFCSVFAGQIIKTYGSWDLNNGFNYKGMNSLRIASDLFAHCIGKYAQSAINKVNTCWGDGWILNNSKSDTICIRNDDENAWKYEKIWFAAANIKAYAQKEGIYIVL